MHWQVALLQLPQSPAASSVVARASGTLFPERHSRGAVRTLMLATVCVKLFRNPVPMRVRFVYFPMTRPAGWTKVASRRKMLLSCIQHRWASPSYDTNTTGTIYLAAIPATLPTRLPERRLWKSSGAVLAAVGKLGVRFHHVRLLVVQCSLVNQFLSWQRCVKRTMLALWTGQDNVGIHAACFE
jgi:hypothetical protein